MKIQGTSNTDRAQPIRRKTIERSGSVSSSSSVSSVRNIQDTTSILGIPQAEMTPKVRDAIMTLMAEVENMRHELEIAHRRISELERLADQG